MCNVEGLSQGFLGDKVKEVNYMTSKTFSTLRIRLLGYELLLIAMSLSQFFFFKLFYFIYFWPHWVFVVVCRLLISVASLVAEHGL